MVRAPLDKMVAWSADMDLGLVHDRDLVDALQYYDYSRWWVRVGLARYGFR
jgi:hypothetical protein